MRVLTSLSLLTLTLFWGSCSTSQCPQGKLTVGFVNYEGGETLSKTYQNFKSYLAESTCKFVEIEPVFNELTAIERINNKDWSLVFAPPGAAAIAISQAQYEAIFQLEISASQRGVIIVREDSKLKTLADLANRKIALENRGSAPGYYLPLYELYGLNFQEISLAPLPKTILEWLAERQVDAGAMSEDEFRQYRREFPAAKFRVLHKTREIPPGLVLLSSQVERKQAEKIIEVMKAANPAIIGDLGYLPTAEITNYQEFIKLIQKTRKIEAKLKLAAPP